VDGDAIGCGNRDAAAVLAAADAKEEARLAEVGWEEATWQWAADQDPDLLLSLSSWSSTTHGRWGGWPGGGDLLPKNP
jgi:hypothetical protein